MRVVVIGSRGQLGRELCQVLGDDAMGLDRGMLDITDRENVDVMLRSLAPDLVINTAAYTLVDKAEDDPAICYTVNATAVDYLAETCNAIGAALVQISTDYVFGTSDGRHGPHKEGDATSPQGVYAKSKLAGELNAAKCQKHYIVRTCGLYGVRPAGHTAGNFVDTMLRLGRERPKLRIVDDQTCTPSYVPHVARGIVDLIKTPQYGIYHLVNGGAASWHDFAAEIFRQAGISVELERITTAQYGAKAPRPRYSVLDTSKFYAITCAAKLPHWSEALSMYLNRALQPQMV